MKATDCIREVAGEVRAKCLKFAMSKASEDRDYHECKDLEMMCAVASTALAVELRRRRIDPDAKVVMGDFDGCSHCWVSSQGMIVDITATQFGMGKIEIHQEGTYEAGRWKLEAVGEPGDVAQDWGPEQAPEVDVLHQILGTK